jgi:hypothetical protein
VLVRSLRWVLAVLFLASLLAGVTPPAAVSADPGATVHPRLLFSAADVPGLRARIAAGGIPGAAWDRLREKLDYEVASVSPDLIRNGTMKYDGQNQLNSYLIELGMGYQMSGNPTYGRKVIDLLLAIGDAGYPFWSGQDLGLGDLLEGIGLGFDWTYELMTAAERAEIIGDLTAHEALLFDRVLLHPTNSQSDNPISNWMGVTAGGAGLTLLAVKGEPGLPAAFQTYLDKAQQKVGQYLGNAPGVNGENQEGYQYSGYGLKNAVPYAVAAKREGLGDVVTGTGAQKMSHWGSFEQVPGEANSFLPLNDSTRVMFGPDIPTLFMAMAPTDGVTQWFWRRTVGDLGEKFYDRGSTTNSAGWDDKCTFPLNSPAGYALCQTIGMHSHVWTILFYKSPAELPEVNPATVDPLTQHFTNRGLVDARTGFANGKNEVVSSFEARRNGTSHFQYDLGNFTLYGGGGHWAIDPGYSCVGCGSTSEAGYATDHNVVVIDGAKETQYVWSRYFTGTTIDDYLSGPGLSFAHADLRYAYNFEGPYAGRAQFFNRAAGRPVTLAIADSVQRDAAGAHAYTWQMITKTGNTVVPDGGAGFKIVAPSGAVLTGRAALDGNAAAPPTVLTKYQPFDNASDDAPGGMAVFTTTAAKPAFDELVVMALTPAGSLVQPTQATVAATGGNVVSVLWNGVRDVYISRLAGSATVSGSSVFTDGPFAKLTENAGESMLRGGTLLSAFGKDYITVTGSAANVWVSGGQVNASGPAGNSYRIYAPGALTSVVVNGAAVSSCRTGDYVVAPC